MPGKRANPMIGRLSELFISGSRTGFFDIATAAGTSSPRSPLDHTRTQSPRGRGLKNYDLGGCGVGLGIVAALDKSSSDGKHEIVAKRAVCSPSLNRSSGPIPVYSPGKNCQRCVELEEEEEDMDSSENFTYVTCHLPNKSVTKVYYDVSEYNGVGLERRSDKSGSISKPKESPARFGEDFAAYPTSHFLSSCHLCKKKLQGKDIFMYRGEKAFCSVECRSRQIMMDERKEQCRSEVPRSAEVSSSSYTRSPIFSTGIVAV